MLLKSRIIRTIIKMSASRLTTLFVLTNALLGTAIAAPSPGCAANNTLPKGQTPGGDSVTVAFTQSDGTARDYRIHIPSTYVSTTPAELIFSFHGHGTGASGQETISQLSNEAFNPSGIAVYPQGKSVSFPLRLTTYGTLTTKIGCMARRTLCSNRYQ